ncbi:MAG: hypothetical protein KU38_00250 [Sulfurovum sp. FS08-3]|nr:MAG: hypothetical protein KU38_00250 [Sulfurovum sp. FS08-3]
MEQTLSTKAKDYFENKMCINLEYLEKEILNIYPQKLKLLYEFIEFLMSLKVPNSSQYFDIEDFINEKCNDFDTNKNLLETDKEYYIFATIRHAFISFKEGGILQMYQYSENEEWYPKIKINQYLGIDADIDELGDEIVIYRGTSIYEYNSKRFGQSWSLSYDIASKFAFEHYKYQPNYQDTLRVILKATVSKSIVFYYKSYQSEDEVIINNNLIKIDDVEIIEQTTLLGDKVK